ncbi:L-threonine ammonia-lyase-like isoform X1 [Seriola dumerili]|uniref:L-threonine ammonia-lyase-like isoform X1 n=1 Tax=Seriola dumerili TaxID=41447 RepID=UPI000BBE39C7|nr:L-threonine ammonia-lyase-like isoform X1 [Seriola dumerili]
MNFAAQLFYSSYLSERLERLYSPRLALKDSEENDPFWQRWEITTCSLLDPPDLPPTQINPVVTDLISSRSSEVGSSSTVSQPLSSVTLIPPPHPPPLTKTPSNLQSLPLTPPPHLNHESKSTKPTTGPPNPCLAAVVPKSRVHKLPPDNRPSPQMVFPQTSLAPSLSSAGMASSSSIPPSSSSFSLAPTSCRGERLPTFQALVDLLLHLVLYLVLLIVTDPEKPKVTTGLKREELHLGPSQPGASYKCCPISNGTVGRRPTLIEPERLKDFGEEELLNGDVKVYDTKVVGGPEIMLMDPPKTRRVSEFRIVPRPPAQYLRFEDISAAAFRIQSGIQKTPCTYSRLSKQYGMEIYLKKEHLHYTGSVKERGVLYLLTSLTQEQQRKGVIVATDCNFSMAVAHHAVELKIPMFVIMPSCVSSPRLRIYRDYGAMVISYGSTGHDSQNHARHLAKENGYLYVEEDESAAYLAGLGTVGMEIYEQVPKLDAVVVPAAGQYGLLAGTAAAIKHLNSQTLVIGVEPEGFPLLLQSLKTDSPVKDMHSNPNKKLYGDLMERSLGVNTFQLSKKLVDKVITVSEEDSLVAMLRFQEFERSTVDTEGAMGLAAILAGQLPELRGKRVAVVVSSANMELELVRQCVDRALVLDDRVSKFSVQLGEWPGDMAKLLDVLSREDVRLLDVCHRRHGDKSDLFKAKVECVVETRDKSQSAQLRKTLSDRYPSIFWLDR